MKKLISVVLTLNMCTALLTGCGALRRARSRRLMYSVFPTIR